MELNIGDTIFYKDKIWKINNIKVYLLSEWSGEYEINDEEITTYYFENGNMLDKESDRYKEIINTHIKYGTFIIPFYKYREIRINEIINE